MSLYTKARKHIDMNRVKELHEEKIKRKKIVDEIREQIREELGNLNSPEFSNWREGIAEGMTSSGMFNTTLPATGDVDLVTTEQTFETSFNGNNESVSGGEVILSGSSNSIAGGEHTIYRRAMFKVDASRSSTLKLTIAKGGGTSSWTDRDPAESFNDQVKLNVYSDADPFDSPSSYNANVGSGTHLINLPKNYSDLVIQIEQFAKVSGTGTLRITGASLQRRTPMNVFVSLDSPEATSFIRTDPTMTGLSAEERKKKLMDMLDAGDEYLLKYLGLIGSSARPSDTTMPDSWEDAADTNPEPYMDIKIGDEYSDEEIARMPDHVRDSIMRQYGKGDGKPLTPEDQKNIIDWQKKLKKAGGGGDKYGDIAAVGVPRNTGGKGSGDPNKIIWPRDTRGGGKRPPDDNPATWPSILDKASGDGEDKKKDKKKDKVIVTHYKPEGRVLSEKKKLKSVKDVPIKKIPGYYDGKPAPLGFPMQEPPKMIDGYHPDLVDGKKIANRFNRLDPASAKAMPPTGNPHIDKKVRAAAKKPK
jgi:hypothetical protein